MPDTQPPADQIALRDRIRRAICEAEGFLWDTDMLEPDEYGDIADAVLAVLPEALYRATARAQPTERPGCPYDCGTSTCPYLACEDDEAARLTAEVHATAPPVCICGHPAQQHHEDACLVCDCGDYLEPEAAREEIARLTQAAAPCADQTALRARIAQAVRHYPGCTPLTDGACYRIADAVLAVLPAPADRAAIYRGLAAWYERGVAEAIPGERPDWYEALADVARGLRRLAAEAPQPEGAIDLADGPVRCPLCPHTVTLHTPNGARAHFTAVHPEQRLVGRGPWPLLGAPPAPEQAAMTEPADRAAIYNPALRVVLADAAEAQPADGFAEVRARCPEHGTRTETYPECRCPATRPDDTTGAPR